MKSIYCNSMEEFLEVIHGLTMRGLTFEAYAKDLQIHLTGGF